MNNLAMQRKLQSAEAFDVSKCPRLGPYYVLPEEMTALDDGKLDLCDAQSESWIWSAGKAERDMSFEVDGVAHLVPKGTHIASLVADLYQRDGIDCTFLR